MRAGLRLFAAAQQQSVRYLEPGAPTGLTGLYTHSSPRSTLLYIYNNTLEKLKFFPEHSVYRQSTEALTKQRLSIIESVKPAGLEEWQTRIQKTVDSFPNAFKRIPLSAAGSDGSFNIVWKPNLLEGTTSEAWKAKNIPKKGFPEGPRDAEDKANMAALFEMNPAKEEAAIPKIEPEPALTVEQIGQIETQIAAGLIEEVIQVAEAENVLVDMLAQSQVWEDLEEKPDEGQWTYFERGTHTPQTQAN